MALISLTTGSETIADGFVKVHAFHVPGDQGGKEVALFATAKIGQAVRPQGQPVYEGAVAGIKREIGGMWIIASYEIREGEIIKLFVQKRRSWNSLIASAQILLRIRQNGPHTKISIPLLQVSGKSRFSEATVEGRFDIITPQEAFTQAGVKVPPHFIHFYAKTAQDLVFHITRVSPEIARVEKLIVKTVQNEAGATVAVRERVRRRTLEM